MMKLLLTLDDQMDKKKMRKILLRLISLIAYKSKLIKKYYKKVTGGLFDDYGIIHMYSSKVGPLEPSCSLKDQLCFTLLLKGSNFKAHREVWSKVGPLKSNLAPKDQLCLNTCVPKIKKN